MPFDLSELRLQPLGELVDAARDVGIDNANNLRRQDLLFEVARNRVARAGAGTAEGILEILADGFGFLRWGDCNFAPGPDDVYVSPSQIRRFNLRTGDSVRGQIRSPKEGERYFALIKIEAVNGTAPDDERGKVHVDNLRPVHATRAIPLGGQVAGPLARLIDAYAPIGFGHRVRVRAVAQLERLPMLLELGAAVRAGDPAAHVFLVLLDARPEVVTEASAAGTAAGIQVVAATFDESPARQTQVADMMVERARRLVEQGRDVVVIVDSLTALARSHHASATPGGRELMGVIDVAALQRVRRFFGAGRALEGGGTLTLIGVVTETVGDTFDQVLDRELRGISNVDLVLDAELAATPGDTCIDLGRSSCREPALLLEEVPLAALLARRSGLGERPDADLGAALASLAGSAGPLDSAAPVGKKGYSAEHGSRSNH
jgi:transcription termination factor Rho